MRLCLLLLLDVDVALLLPTTDIGFSNALNPAVLVVVAVAVAVPITLFMSEVPISQLLLLLSADGIVAGY
jgi:hypothetical protein